MKTSRPGLAILLAAALALAGCLGCGIEKHPIGILESGQPELELGYPEHRSLGLRFEPFAYPIAGGCPTVSIHLTDRDGRLVRTFDHRPPAWVPGERLGYDLTLYQSALAEPLPAGRYRLWAGAYSQDLGMRHTLVLAGGRTAGRRHEIASVTVPETAASRELGFAGDWEGPEAGSDSQVLVRRWFRRQARLILRDAAATEPIELWLLLYLPRAAPSDLSLEPGELDPRVEVGSSCTADRASIATGRRELRFAIPAAELRRGCSLELRANYEVRSDSIPRPRSASLEAISWRPR